MVAVFLYSLSLFLPINFYVCRLLLPVLSERCIFLLLLRSAVGVVSSLNAIGIVVGGRTSIVALAVMSIAQGVKIQHDRSGRLR